MKFGVVVFPGSNCDYDTLYAVRDVFQQDAEFLWHKDHDLRGADCIILPGGFSYGDYLRSGAIARFSPLMQEVRDFASQGGMVLGICNGFQVLLELGLLPGAMLRNTRLKFLCQHVQKTLFSRFRLHAFHCFGFHRVSSFIAYGAVIVPHRGDTCHYIELRITNYENFYYY